MEGRACVKLALTRYHETCRLSGGAVTVQSRLPPVAADAFAPPIPTASAAFSTTMELYRGLCGLAELPDARSRRRRGRRRRRASAGRGGGAACGGSGGFTGAAASGGVAAKASPNKASFGDAAELPRAAPARRGACRLAADLLGDVATSRSASPEGPARCPARARVRCVGRLRFQFILGLKSLIQIPDPHFS